jgi:hypothetical protein
VLRVILQQIPGQVEDKKLTIERFSELLRDASKQVPMRKKSRQGSEASPPGGEEAARSFEKQEVGEGPRRGSGKMTQCRARITYTCISGSIVADISGNVI